MIARGTLLAFSGSWSSGLAQLIIGRIENGLDVVEGVILCDNGPTARSLIAAFDCAGPDHTIDNSKIRGREIVCAVDEMGLLSAFMPAEEYDNAPQT